MAAASPALGQRLPNCVALQARLAAGAAPEDALARELTAEAPALLAGVGAFRRQSAASAAALASHTYRLEGRPEPVKVGVKSAALAAELAPLLELDELQAVQLLRRVLGRAGEAPPAGPLPPPLAQRCAEALCAERLAVLAVLQDVLLTALAAAEDDDAQPKPRYAAAAEETLAKLLEQVRARLRTAPSLAAGRNPDVCTRARACARQGLADRLVEQLCAAVGATGAPVAPPASPPYLAELWAAQVCALSEGGWHTQGLVLTVGAHDRRWTRHACCASCALHFSARAGAPA